MKSGLTVVVDKMKQVSEAMHLLAQSRVMIGVPAEKASRSGEPINNASLAYIHSTGSPEANIPARPFLEPAIKRTQSVIESGLRKAGEFALDGKTGAVERQFMRVGQGASDEAKLVISEGIPPPLKPATIAARKRKYKGRTGTNTTPLVSTGALRNAITFVVRKNGK